MGLVRFVLAGLVLCDRARSGWVFFGRQGAVGCGLVQCIQVRWGMVRQAWCGMVRIIWCGIFWSGMAGQVRWGTVGFGLIWQARWGKARYGLVRFDEAG